MVIHHCTVQAYVTCPVTVMQAVPTSPASYAFNRVVSCASCSAYIIIQIYISTHALSHCMLICIQLHQKLLTVVYNYSMLFCHLIQLSIILIYCTVCIQLAQQRNCCISMHCLSLSLSLPCHALYYIWLSMCQCSHCLFYVYILPLPVSAYNGSI